MRSKVASNLLDIKEVSHLTGMSVSTVRRRSMSGEFPPHVKRGKSTRWHSGAVNLWLEIQDKKSNKWIRDNLKHK